MPIQFTCPHCGTQTDVAEEFAGQSGPCAGCGRTVTVPPPLGTPGYSSGSGGSGAAIAVVILAIVGFLVLLLCGGSFFFLAFNAGPMVAPMPATVQSGQSSMCTSNLQRISVAMHRYHGDYGCFPAAYVADEDGNPLYSWRVLLLPYLESEDVYDQFNLDQPWDSPANLALAGMMPDVYRCPDDWQNDGSQTSYVMIVGQDTISDGPTATKMEDIEDDIASTILVVERSGSGIIWSEPRDLQADEINFFINDGSDQGIGSEHFEGVYVVFSDGSVRLIGDDTDPDQVEGMSTIAGGEIVDEMPEF